MSDQAYGLRELVERQRISASRSEQPDSESRARTIAVAGGKGGVGKTNLALNLALALARLDARVCLLDADLGLGNIDLLCGLNGYWNLSHVISGARSLQDVVLTGPGGIHVVSGAAGLGDVADCSASALRAVLAQLRDLEQDHDFILIDTGSGIHRTVRRFLSAADLVLLVTTPEPTAIADTYAAVKVLAGDGTDQLRIVVNRASTPDQARSVAERLGRTGRMFLRKQVIPAGFIPEDPHVAQAVARRRPFLIDAPQSPASLAVEQLARRLRPAVEPPASNGGFFSRVWRRHAAKAA